MSTFQLSLYRPTHRANYDPREESPFVVVYKARHKAPEGEPSERPGSAEPTSEHPAHVRIRRSNALVAVTR